MQVSTTWTECSHRGDFFCIVKQLESLSNPFPIKLLFSLLLSLDIFRESS